MADEPRYHRWGGAAYGMRLRDYFAAKPSPELLGRAVTG